MISKDGLRLSSLTLAACVLSFLMFRYSGYFQNGSHDFVQHYLLVDEIMKYGGVRPDSFNRMGAMAYYPPVTHWLAALIGWIGGSGIVGLIIVAIAAAFLTYLLVLSLVAGHSPVALALFIAGFLALSAAKSLVGWEVVGNFFLPQLVGDALYFAALLLAARAANLYWRTAAFIAVGTLTMWVQPLNAVHILATGCVLIVLQGIQQWRERRSFPMSYAVFAVVICLVSAIAIVANPVFRVMQQISANNGYLGFGYEHIMRVAAVCLLISGINALRWLTGKGERVDSVLASAGIAACLLVVMQFLVLRFHGDGSDYAVKKHMFLVLTAGLLNLVRLITTMTGSIGQRQWRATALLFPLLAGYLSTFALSGFTEPVVPTLRAEAYAAQATRYQFPKYVPGNTVAFDRDLPLISNVLVSMSTLQHPFDDQARGWQRGASMLAGMPYAMIRNTPEIDAACPTRYAESADYVIIPANCLKPYVPGSVISFAAGGTGWTYLDAGWGSSEVWGTWALSEKGSQMSMTMAKASKTPYELTVDAMAFLTSSHPSQKMVVEINGIDVATWTYDMNSPAGERRATIPSGVIKDGPVEIVFKAPGAVSPVQLGISADARVLGIGLKTLSLRVASR